MARATMNSPFGPLTLTDADGVLTALDWTDDADGTPTPLLTEAIHQLTAYFDHRLTLFDLPFDWGTGLHAQVRRAMAAIPFGETCTYGDIAREVGAPAQAVGQACGANPLPILIPCHRVLRANGLGGFSAKGGVETKVALLRHEGAASLLI
jgi:methylated-DNA-[protein]-cysteine S-methyltransferase